VGGVSDTVVVITIRSLTQERKVSEESGGDYPFHGDGRGIRYQPQLWDSVTVLSRIWNIWCGRTFSGHFSQEHFAAGFYMEICFRYAAGSHSSHEHIESLTGVALVGQFVHHVLYSAAQKRAKPWETVSPAEFCCDLWHAVFILPVLYDASRKGDRFRNQIEIG